MNGLVGYNVVFVCDYMTVQTQIDFRIEDVHNEEDILNKANNLIRYNYGFNPLDYSHDHEIHEL